MDNSSSVCLCITADTPPPANIVSSVPSSICGLADLQNSRNFVKFYILNIRIEILTLMAINNAVFWDLTRCRLVDIYWYFGRLFCAHPQDRSAISRSLATFTDTFKFYSTFVGLDRSVGIAIRYGLDGPEIESRWGRDFPHLSRPALGPIQSLVQWVPGLSRG